MSELDDLRRENAKLRHMVDTVEWLAKRWAEGTDDAPSDAIGVELLRMLYDFEEQLDKQLAPVVLAESEAITPTEDAG